MRPRTIVFLCCSVLWRCPADAARVSLCGGHQRNRALWHVPAAGRSRVAARPSRRRGFRCCGCSQRGSDWRQSRFVVGPGPARRHGRRRRRRHRRPHRGSLRQHNAHPRRWQPLQQPERGPRRRCGHRCGVLSPMDGAGSALPRFRLRTCHGERGKSSHGGGAAAGPGGNFNNDSLGRGRGRSNRQASPRRSHRSAMLVPRPRGGDPGRNHGAAAAPAHSCS
mmetsp:Transcript_10787/g.41854  ORF Transcript_10787/g.41854 Transcript_10787/m.41854 type:complete len:222 (+) Transcript_10787:53-718(+)